MQVVTIAMPSCLDVWKQLRAWSGSLPTTLVNADTTRFCDDGWRGECFFSGTICMYLCMCITVEQQNTVVAAPHAFAAVGITGTITRLGRQLIATTQVQTWPLQQP